MPDVLNRRFVRKIGAYARDFTLTSQGRHGFFSRHRPDSVETPTTDSPTAPPAAADAELGAARAATATAQRTLELLEPEPRRHGAAGRAGGGPSPTARQPGIPNKAPACRKEKLPGATCFKDAPPSLLYQLVATRRYVLTAPSASVRGHSGGRCRAWRRSRAGPRGSGTRASARVVLQAQCMIRKSGNRLPE